MFAVAGYLREKNREKMIEKIMNSVTRVGWIPVEKKTMIENVIFISRCVISECFKKKI